MSLGFQKNLNTQDNTQYQTVKGTDDPPNFEMGQRGYGSSIKHYLWRKRSNFAYKKV